MSDTFTCAICRKTFDKLLTDEEATAQLGGEFPGFKPEDCGVVCDDCLNRHFTGDTPEQPTSAPPEER
jgi:hypothetical protein